jgi:hypothetical protein
VRAGSSIGLIAAELARTSNPPPNISSLSNARTKEPEIVPPTTSVKTTSMNIASVMPVRKRFRSG